MPEDDPIPHLDLSDLEASRILTALEICRRTAWLVHRDWLPADLAERLDAWATSRLREILAGED